MTNSLEKPSTNLILFIHSVILENAAFRNLMKAKGLETFSDFNKYFYEFLRKFNPCMIFIFLDSSF